MSAKVHLDVTPKGATIHRTACGILSDRGVRSLDAVTCKVCRKKIAQAQAASAEAAMKSASDSPVAAFGCSQGAPCGTCSVCKMEQEAARYEHYAPWQLPSRLPPRSVRFASVAHALETYARIREEGYGYGSSASAFETLREYGCRLEFAPSSETRAIAAAEDAALLEGLLFETFESFARERCLDIRVCIEALIARVVGRVELVTSRWGRQHRNRVPIPASEISERLGIPRGEVGIIVRSGKSNLSRLLIERSVMEEK